MLVSVTISGFSLRQFRFVYVCSVRVCSSFNRTVYQVVDRQLIKCELKLSVFAGVRFHVLLEASTAKYDLTALSNNIEHTEKGKLTTSTT